MAARLWTARLTALLVLVGVFVMHGVQCTTAADGVGHPSPAAHSAGLAPTGTPQSGPAEAAVAHAVVDTGVTGAVLPDTAADHPAPDQAQAAAVTADGAGAPHKTAGHLWTVCLAVLAAALAVLLAILLPHPGLLARLALTRVRALLRSVTAARPPDLSQLCLLRI